MNQKIYRYGTIFQVIRFILLTTGIWLPAIILFNSYLKYSWDSIFLKSPQYWLLLILITLVFGYNGIVFGHVFSKMKIDSDGLYLEYFWRYIFVPWSNVYLKRSVLYIESLPLFYYGQGLLFRWSFKKIVLIFPNISDYQVLLEDIDNHTKNNKQKHEIFG